MTLFVLLLIPRQEGERPMACVMNVSTGSRSTTSDMSGSSVVDVTRPIP